MSPLLDLFRPYEVALLLVSLHRPCMRNCPYVASRSHAASASHGSLFSCLKQHRYRQPLPGLQPQMTHTIPQATVEKTPLSPSRISRSTSAKVMQESLAHELATIDFRASVCKFQIRHSLPGDSDCQSEPRKAAAIRKSFQRPKFWVMGFGWCLAACVALA